ncbi:MAG: methyl-accepting chemotaxis protein [Oscillatoriales cyanobacterium]|uniref:methyl-accepting chemotaxis protein n=1 Tax=Microcoleus sp. PH2017_05_CCC_O_A TaxID=2798816 RepID=UPI001DEC583F|nr:methyl-accepting chemotaxis protein [Microcoleus sp. PH2017_05_CCC_O_A]TAG07776.1 MAG: methyl-accepting chemotaxis protein [Oscillatoriales cyanobacterium]MCC3434162.1 HAMP domain-containing protein [Microcoleus sp. PH2017_05_CCC_O_A]TAG17153.1 MAG: methyl-accepting chemotaxis protein [Oscillatoriales cyanobacterium]TAG43883.1 MAG: methyl-accepting chemotaxis protein [Oscillatoriales cyanobacterium]TAG58208.1 MAG: methyl-accepting chemotaxis protein [Oscillatoriales cyanobacterium]
MATSTNFQQDYQRAEAAYMDGNYSEAAALVYQLVEDFPEDPSARLLCGHIYCYGLQQYEVAREQYMVVLSLSDDPSLVEHAHGGISHTDQFLSGELHTESFEALSAETELEFYPDLSLEEGLEDPDLALFQGNSPSMSYGSQSPQDMENEDLADLGMSGLEWEPQDSSSSAATSLEDLTNPFAGDSGAMAAYADASEPLDMDEFGSDLGDPFGLDDPGFDAGDLSDSKVSGSKAPYSGELFSEAPTQVLNGQSFAGSETGNSFDSEQLDSPTGPSDNFGEPFAPLDLPDELDLNDDDYDYQSPPVTGQNQGQKPPLPEEADPFAQPMSSGFGSSRSQSKQPNIDSEYSSNYSLAEDETLLMGGAVPNSQSQRSSRGQFNSADRSNSNSNGYGDSEPQAFGSMDSFELDAFDDDAFSDSFSLDENEQATAFGAATKNSSDWSSRTGNAQEHSGFLDEFDDFDDLGNLPDFDISEDANSSILTRGNTNFGNSTSGMMGTSGSGLDFDNSDGSAIRDDEIFSISGPADASVPTFAPTESEAIDSSVTVEQGGLAFLENAPLFTKQLYTAIGAGLVSLVAVAFVTNIASYQALKQDKPEAIVYLRQTGWVMTAAAGFTSFLTSWGIGQLIAKQVRKSSDNLQAQFDAVSQGTLDARATIYSEDEFGKMAAKFNHMAKVIQTTISDTRRKSDEQEQAKEDLQRQVIRLLDDVEGAARGDLTVTAEVTADVLGAVADSFNLTIQNLREIVHQVKQAAREVSKGATDSAKFAGDLSSDALRQAEELAATLNSVQVLTDAIQRVAESAREAEEVARGAAATALKGGEAVERTVAGILEIRETVAETTRKVKRLAEASQEISKIVGLIAAIASRTNLLALNASIEAARAGESGRGFAIVADEVRQLADRSAKSLKEIEQIVMQIQSETGAVMTAMEEGTQQVIEGTRLAEQAKRSLEDIIQVTNRIDVLVRSITADTVEQNETARSVAAVMQAVELTAQETSQEAQRVSGALQNLVGVARDLLTSVERFRVETAERQ